MKYRGGEILSRRPIHGTRGRFSVPEMRPVLFSREAQGNCAMFTLRACPVAPAANRKVEP
jgi:hypothetical protein